MHESSMELKKQLELFRDGRENEVIEAMEGLIETFELYKNQFYQMETDNKNLIQTAKDLNVGNINLVNTLKNVQIFLGSNRDVVNTWKDGAKFMAGLDEFVTSSAAIKSGVVSE